jgi:hypothetical protein
METLISLFWSAFAFTLIARFLLRIVGLADGVKLLDRALATLLVAALGLPLFVGAIRPVVPGHPTAPALSQVGATLTTATSFVVVVVVVGHVLFLGFVLYLRHRVVARRTERERVVRGRERVAPRAEIGGRR